MSFAEKNKVWLLPLLGLGIAGVVYLNIRTFKGDSTPATAESQAPAPPAQDTAAPAPAPAATPEAPQDTTGDLWADLRSLARTPDSLSEDRTLRERSRVRLGQDLEAQNPNPLPRPQMEDTLEWLTAKTPQAKGSGEPATTCPAPELEFLVHGPSGSHAWFQGQPFRAGQSLPGQGYSVQKIGKTFVELKGPKGTTTQSTNVIHEAKPQTKTDAETP